MKSIIIPYTICFCVIDDSVLMLYRTNPPNQHLWNGIGGKIEADEVVQSSLYREVLEESAIDLSDKRVRYSGVVCWNSAEKQETKGMFCFIVPLSVADFFPERKTREGILAWKPIQWVIEGNNKEVVSNIHQFLPKMLELQIPQLYRCFYTEGVLQRVNIEPLPSLYNLSL